MTSPPVSHRLSVLLAALLVATVLGPVAGAPRGAVIEDGDGAGWLARAPAWHDPGQRGATFAAGDTPRALPPRHATRDRLRPASAGGVRRRAPNGAKRPSLTVLGRRQSDGG